MRVCHVGMYRVGMYTRMCTCRHQCPHMAAVHTFTLTRGCGCYATRLVGCFILRPGPVLGLLVVPVVARSGWL